MALTNKELKSRLEAIPEEEPTAAEKDLIVKLQAETDNDVISLEEMKTLCQYSGKISLRVPKSLHKDLTESAKIEGVSLNQYALYKLSK